MKNAPKYKRAKIDTDGEYFYVGTPNYPGISRYSTLWSACRAAVRAHREWIDKQPTGRFDSGVKITLPDGRWRMGYLSHKHDGVILLSVQGKRK